MILEYDHGISKFLLSGCCFRSLQSTQKIVLIRACCLKCRGRLCKTKVWMKKFETFPLLWPQSSAARKFQTNPAIYTISPSIQNLRENINKKQDKSSDHFTYIIMLRLNSLFVKPSSSHGPCFSCLRWQLLFPSNVFRTPPLTNLTVPLPFSTNR